jgi:cellulose biosynthesis protein BcsQ
MAKWRETKSDDAEKEILVKTQDELSRPADKRYAALRRLLGDTVVDQWVQRYSDETDMPEDGRSIFDDDEEDDDAESDE